MKGFLTRFVTYSLIFAIVDLIVSHTIIFGVLIFSALVYATVTQFLFVTKPNVISVGTRNVLAFSILVISYSIMDLYVLNPSGWIMDSIAALLITGLLHSCYTTIPNMKEEDEPDDI
jgi:hypothetical protein